MKPLLSQVCGDLVKLNSIHHDNLAGHIGIQITTVGRDYVAGTMPVDERTVQPFGILHGGASMVLAETLGSVASYLLVSGTQGVQVAGIEVGGSHVRSVRSGHVTGMCRPVRIGRTLHFWQIDIRDGADALCCTARLTVSIITPRGEGTP